MLNVIFRFSTQCAKRLQILRYSSFTARDIIHESNDESGTLLLRFSRHLAIELQKDDPLVATNVRYSDYFPVTDVHYFKKELQKTAVDQLPALYTFASTYRSNADPAKYSIILNELDAAALQNLSSMSEETIWRTLYALLFLMPNWMTRTDFYHAALKRLTLEFTDDNLSKDKFVRFCFYIGLEKKYNTQKNNQLKPLIEKFLEKLLPELSTMDLALVSNALYKTATAVQSEAYNQRLAEEVTKLISPEDDALGAKSALLITFIKSLRFQRVNSAELCEKLSDITLNEKMLKSLQARGLVHIFAYFAENLWDKAECIAAISKSFLQRLQQQNGDTTFEELVRPKDLATFVFAISQLNASLCTDELRLVENSILRMIRQGAYQYFPNQLVDTCLSLWILGYKSDKILQQSIIAKSQQAARANQRNQPKVDGRLTVLQTAASIEIPDFANQLNILPTALNLESAVPDYLLLNRTDLKDYVEQLTKEADVKEPRIVCPLNGINIPNILVTFKDAANIDSKTFVELLTPAQMLRYSGAPIGIVRLKIRLLKALGHKVVVLRSEDLKTENYTSLKSFLDDDDGEEDAKKQTARSI